MGLKNIPTPVAATPLTQLRAHSPQKTQGRTHQINKLEANQAKVVPVLRLIILDFHRQIEKCLSNFKILLNIYLPKTQEINVILQVLFH